MSTRSRSDATPPKKRTHARDAILSAARERIAAEGYGALGIREVAERAGYAVGTVYLHFRDKPDLVRQLLSEDFATLARRLAAVRASEPVARLKKIAESYLEFARESPERYRLLFMTAGLPNPQDTPEIQVSHQGDPDTDGYRVLSDAMRSALEAGGASLRASEVDSATQLFWGGLHGIASVRTPLNETWVPWSARAALEKKMIAILLESLLPDA